MTALAQRLIDESMAHDDHIACAEWSEEAAADLLAACEDWCESRTQDGATVLEYWADLDDQGRDCPWRVHMTRPAAE